jgi:hypothetical protein
VEAVFRPEIFRIFSNAFLQNTVTFPHLFCRILRDAVAGIIYLGYGGLLPR